MPASNDQAHPSLADSVSPLVLTGLDQPLWLQNSVYPAAVDRLLIEAAVPVGVLGSGDLIVSQRASGANMSVDVAAGRAAVTLNDTTNQGRALVRSTAVNNLAIAGAPAAGTSRIDLVIARVYDASLIGGSINGWQLEVVTGTAASTPAVPALPKSSLLLAQVAVAAGQASVLAANITDRRYPFPRMAPTEGFFYNPLGGSIVTLDVALTSFTMPFYGHVIAMAEALFVPGGGGAGLTVALANFSGTSTPAPSSSPQVAGPYTAANQYRATLPFFGQWTNVAAGTAVTIKAAIASSAGAGTDLQINHFCGSYRCLPFL
jgi:hypothetical protein